MGAAVVSTLLTDAAADSPPVAAAVADVADVDVDEEVMIDEDDASDAGAGGDVGAAACSSDSLLLLRFS
jgi:hypothetical protein